MVDNAFTTGEIPERIIEKIYKDNVCTDAPAQKNEIKKSSNETMTANKNAEKIAGDKKGTTTLKKVYCVDAPKSKDASINVSSSSS